MAAAVILMMLLGRIERLQGHNLRDDRPTEDLRISQLLDVRFGDTFLLGVRVEDRRAVLRPNIRTLPVELCRIVGDLEEHLQQLSVRNLPRIVGDLDRLSMAGPSRAHQIIVSGRRVAARVSRNDVIDAGNLPEDRFGAPKTSSRQDSRLVPFEEIADPALVVDRRIRKACRTQSQDAQAKDTKDGAET